MEKKWKMKLNLIENSKKCNKKQMKNGTYRKLNGEKMKRVVNKIL